MKNFSELVADVGSYLGRPDTTYQTAIKRYINLAVRDYYRQFPSALKNRRTTFVATGEQAQGLPADVDRPVWLMDATNYRPLEAGVLWDEMYPYQLADGPAGYVFEWDFDGEWPLIKQPDGVLQLSSSASDARTVRVQGLVADSASSGLGTEYYVATEQITLNGSTPVTLATDFDYVQTIAASEKTGTVVHIRNGSGQALGSIPPYETSPRHVWVKWIYTPSAGTKIMMEYIPKVPHLQYDDQGLPSVVPWDFVYWHAIKQGAADLQKNHIVREAVDQLRQITQQERIKDLAYGDGAYRGVPFDDDREYLEGVEGIV